MYINKALIVFCLCLGLTQQSVCAQIVDTHGMLFQFNNDSTAAVVCVQNVKRCGILPCVEWNGIGYVVNCIGTNAFYCRYSVQNVYIPETVIRISPNAFFQCTSLQHIYMECSEPPVCDDNAFADIDFRRCVLHVPSGSLQRYKNSEAWSRFRKIKEYKKK